MPNNSLQPLGTLSGIHDMLKTAIFLSFLLAASSPALAKTMTAVCGPFKGYTVGISGSNENHKSLSYVDSMDGEFTLVWEFDSKSALIIGPGAKPTREEGVVPIGTKAQLSFIVTYPISVFVYSIFPDRKTMLITKHTHSRGLEFDAARGFIMRGDCKISIK